MVKVFLCPFLKKQCVENQCAVWDPKGDGNGCCGLYSIAQSSGNVNQILYEKF